MGVKYSKSGSAASAAANPPASAPATAEPAATTPAVDDAAPRPPSPRAMQPAAGVSPLPPGLASRKRRVSVSAEVDKSKEPVVKKVVPKEQAAIDEIKASVKANFLFNSLPPEQLEEVVDAMEARTYADGDTIIQEGADGDNFYVVASGECNVFISAKNDGAPVRTIKGGGAFGELALMYNAPRSATIKAKGDVKCWALDRATFRRTIMAAGQARRKKYEQFLAKVQLLSHLMPAEIAQLADAVEPLTFNEGDVVVQQGDADRPSFKFYIVEDGEAQAFISKDGAEVLMSTLGAGDYFGEKALIQMTPRTATVKALTLLKCACLSIAAFERLMGPCADLLAERATSGYHDVDDVQAGRVSPKGPSKSVRLENMDALGEGAEGEEQLTPAAAQQQEVRSAEAAERPAA